MNRTKICAGLVCLALAPLAHAKKTILPDACGDDKAEFHVNLVDDHPQELKAQEGKALLVVVEEGTSNHFDLTTRYGIDGTWVGATHGSAYFLVPLAPGEHHLCASPQKHFGFTESMREHLVSMTSFTAEAGKVYFFGGKESTTGTQGHTVYVAPPAGSAGPGQYAHTGGSQTLEVDYGFLSDDEGRYRVKVGKLATWKSK
jgi:hypothetical protein